MANSDKSSLFLIAFIPSPKDLEIARVLGWYRIPLRTSPKVIAVDYIAFYQPASFGDGRWQIEYFAEVRGNELASRSELIRDEPEHPRADEEYFKIQLGPLQRLERPIKTEKWKRFTFLYTTGENFFQADNVEDLTVRSDDRKLLWQAIRERAESGLDYQVAQPEEEIPADILRLLVGFHEEPTEYSVDAFD
jgi:hypothetical protein